MVDILTVSQDTKIIDLVLANRAESETYLQGSNYYDEWQENHDLYNCIPNKKPYEWMSNKFIPLISSKVKTSVANISNILFSAIPPFQVRAVESNDESVANVIRKLLAYQLKRIDYIPKFIDFILNVAIYGTGILKVYWDTRTETRKIRIPKYENSFNMSFLGLNLPIPIKPKQMEWDTQEETVMLLDQPNFSVVNLADFFFDPMSLEIQDSWVAHRVKRSLSYLHNNSVSKGGVYSNEVYKISGGDTSTDTSISLNIEGNKNRLLDSQVTRPKGLEPIEVLEWWGKYDLYNMERPISCLFTVAGNNRLIRKESNPLWSGRNPFIKTVYNSVPNNFLGEGIPDEGRDIQNTINEIVNQRFDNVSLILNRQIVYRKGSGVNPKNLINKPGGVYSEDEPNGIRWDVPPDVTSSAYRDVNDLERWLQEVTGLTKLTLGIGGADMNQTATGMSLLQRASGERMLYYAKNVERAFNELLKMFYQLDYQFISPGDVVNIAGEQGIELIKITPELLAKDYDINATGILSAANRETKSLRLLQFYNVVKGNPYLKERELLDKLYVFMDIGENSTEILRTEEEQSQAKTSAVMEQLAKVQIGLEPGAGKQGTGQMIGGETMGTPGLPMQRSVVGQNQNL